MTGGMVPTSIDNFFFGGTPLWRLMTYYILHCLLQSAALLLSSEHEFGLTICKEPILSTSIKFNDDVFVARNKPCSP